MASSPSLDGLVDAARSQDRAAVAELCSRVRRIAFHVAFRRFGFSPEDAEDVAQEIVLRSLDHIPNATLNASWVHTGATFLCIDVLRRRRTEQQAGGAAGIVWERSGAVPRKESGISKRDLLMTIASLPAPCAQLLHQHFFEGRTFHELDVARGDGRRRCQFQTRRCLDHLYRALRGTPLDRRG